MNYLRSKVVRDSSDGICLNLSRWRAATARLKYWTTSHRWIDLSYRSGGDAESCLPDSPELFFQSRNYFL